MNEACPRTTSASTSFMALPISSTAVNTPTVSTSVASTSRSKYRCSVFIMNSRYNLRNPSSRNLRQARVRVTWGKLE